MTDSTCTYSSRPCETLDYEKMMQIIADFREKYKDPYEEFANSKGFSLDKGDTMVFPKGFAEAHGIPLRKGIVFSDFVDCSILLMKTSDPDSFLGSPFRIKRWDVNPGL